MMEPWDGQLPWRLATDGRHIGGLQRSTAIACAGAPHHVTDDDLVVMASGIGRADSESNHPESLRLTKMFTIDLEAGRIIDDKGTQGHYSNAKAVQGVD
jgi:hypothetical protein